MLPHHHLYGLAWGAAALAWVICGTLLVTRRTGRAVAARVLALLALAATAALFGARLHFVLLAPDLLETGVLRALLLPLDEGAGLRIGGGLLAAGGLILLLGPRAARGTIGRAALCDVLLPLGGVALAIGRLGCFADGCCFGTVCSRPWCPAFPAWSPAYWSHFAQGLLAETARSSLPVHPLQLYLAAGGLASAATGACVAARGARPGTAALVFVAALASLRTLVEPVRETSFGSGVAYQSALDLSCAGVAVALLLWRAQRRPAVLSGTASKASPPSSRPGTPSRWISRAEVPSSKRGSRPIFRQTR